ncbi:LAME_0E12574g1_1 [Lachancea meyersii CBS 8951]|uniref:tRNA (guanine(37)-N1)-methyltransferase n=1 Tax=Lachancea meyersii CBS 8951 TaxID=1266667 RepID=A0A1G4JM66_9SACH|nr:LAME_0E12574g1_1 [Lachancea meyersii CBS 8951]
MTLVAHRHPIQLLSEVSVSSCMRTSGRNLVRKISMMSSHTIAATTSTMFKYQPPVNRDMHELDRSFFVTKVPMVVVHFPDPKNISLFTSKFKQEVLNIPRISRVVRLETSDAQNPEPPLKKSNPANDNHIRKGVLLRESVTQVDQVPLQLPAEAQQFLKDNLAIAQPYECVLDYSFWKTEEIFRAILPEQFLDEIPSGFTATGHIAHINLRNEFKPYGNLIGQVILDKNSKIETVVDKVDSIATKFRTFHMQVLAGKNDLVVEQRESNCKFKFDFSKVYWNSRLHTEHDRLIQKFKPGQCVGDVFAGVGPFAVPAGKKKVMVLANDLNPESYKYMLENIAENKTDSFVQPSNLDGRDFIRESPRLLAEWRQKTEARIVIPGGRRYKDSKTGETKRTEPQSVQIPQFYHHYVMNLPDSALTFLDEFVGLYSRYPETLEQLKKLPDFQAPWIHCHCFEKYDAEESPEPSMQELHRRVHDRIKTITKTNDTVLPFENLQFHLVRKVAPTKPMFCVSFQLPDELI